MVDEINNNVFVVVDDDIDDELKQLKVYYASNNNDECVKELINAIFMKHLSNDDELFKIQELIVGYILNDELLSKFCISKKYKKKFLKIIVDLLSGFNKEINDSLFYAYLNINDNDVSNNGKKFVIHYLNDDLTKPIVIEQYETIISNGTTGLHVWPAARQLIQYLQDNNHLIYQKNVLELGSGVGITGIYCLKYNQKPPNSYIFTDHHGLVLQQIQNNLSFNNIATSEDDKKSRALVMELDWNEVNSSEIIKRSDIEVDVIIASDIIFDPELIEPLINTLNVIQQKLSNKSIFSIISSTIRNENTYKLFLDSLNDRKFQVEVLKRTTICEHKQVSNVEIIKIFK